MTPNHADRAAYEAAMRALTDAAWAAVAAANKAGAPHGYLTRVAYDVDCMSQDLCGGKVLA